MEGGGSKKEEAHHIVTASNCEIILPATVIPWDLRRKVGRGERERRNREEGEEDKENLGPPHEKGDENSCRLIHELRMQ